MIRSNGIFVCMKPSSASSLPQELEDKIKSEKDWRHKLLGPVDFDATLRYTQLLGFGALFVRFQHVGMLWSFQYSWNCAGHLATS